MSTGIPQSVLAEALQEAIGGRQVRAAVFTTFCFDPGFFELQILPCLFDRPFSQVEKVRRIQLEEAMRSVEDVSVYYDGTALAQDAKPAHLDFRRIDVRRRTGVFHPKVIMVLVDEECDDHDTGSASRTLIVATLSANLTRSGWWENVETGHIEEISDKQETTERCSFRHDLLALLSLIRRSAVKGENHSALDSIQEFVKNRVNTEPTRTNSVRGRYHTRLFVGQKDLPTWLREAGITRREWNLEIISPYFDTAEAGTLVSLTEVLQPRSFRIYLPQELDGTARVEKKYFESVGALGTWCTLPGEILRPAGRKKDQNAAPRFVHAKVYRLWNRMGQEVIITGSVNLTHAALSHARAGNLEAAFLVDQSVESGRPGWWLKPVEHPPRQFAGSARDEDECTHIPVDVSFRFDWSARTLEYRISGEPPGPLTVCETSGRQLFKIAEPRAGEWVGCSPEAAEEVHVLLDSTSFLEIRHEKGAWRILVREEGMSHRPSLLVSLTPEEILLYWSLLSPLQREAILVAKCGSGGELEGLSAAKLNGLSAGSTVFDRFAGVFHGFEHLMKHVREAIERGSVHEAEARIFGRKYDSVPVLLEKVLTSESGDPVIRYLTFLCAQQVCSEVAAEFPEFWHAHRQDVSELSSILERANDLKLALEFSPEMDPTEFLDWFEPVFLKRARVAEVEA